MSFVFVLFGSTGDLSTKRLIPAFYELMTFYNVQDFKILAVSRRDLTSEQYCNEIYKFYKTVNKKVNKEIWNKFSSKIQYFKADFTDNKSMDLLGERIKTMKSDNFLYYLATLPHNYENIINMIRRHSLNKQKTCWKRIILEKPFGFNLRSAIRINNTLSKAFDEDQIYRIDHYLAKEAIENVLSFRFSNVLLDGLLNNYFVDHVQITALETSGIEERGKFYDKTGAIKDMVQSHLLQLMTYITMDNHSETETYTDMKFFINNSRWKGIPFYVRTGKKLKEKHTLIYINFKKTLFSGLNGIKANAVVFRIYPNNDIDIEFNTKKPGDLFNVTQAKFNFCHSCLFGDNTVKDYTFLLNEVIKGDLMLFSSWDEVKTEWKVIDNIPKHWGEIYSYDKNTFGPKEADEFIKKDGREW